MPEVPFTLNPKEIPRRKFLLPDGREVELLADGYHLPRYLARGFKLVQSGDEQVKPENLTCPECGFVADNLTRLGQHKRKHKGRLQKLNEKRG